MSRIEKIRILNLNYNGNTIRIDDEIFDLAGESTLISLRNGGGKSVLVQMIVSLFVNKSYRDFGDRPFKSYFTTNRPTFIITEWKLDQNQEKFMAGMMVRKSQKEDSDTEELEIYTFTGSYTDACSYALEQLPVVKKDGDRKILRGFAECRSILEEISREKDGDFRLYDMSSRYGRSQYFNTLKQYQINNHEWESIIRKVNQKESGLSELFQNARDERNLVENWFLRPVEDKLNQEKDKIEEFRKLTMQFVEQYRSNQSRVERKKIIEQYFADTAQLKTEIEDYVQKYQDGEELKSELILYTDALNDGIRNLSALIKKKEEVLREIDEEIRHIRYEKISYEIYGYETEKEKLVAERSEQEIEITRLTLAKENLLREINKYDLNKIDTEILELEVEKEEVDEKVRVLLQENAQNKNRIEELGTTLYLYYENEMEKQKSEYATHKELLEKSLDKIKKEKEEYNCKEEKIRQLSTQTGDLERTIQNYTETEETFCRETGYVMKRNLLGFYEDGFLELKQKEIQEERQEKENKLAEYSKEKNTLSIRDKKLEQEYTNEAVQISRLENSIEGYQKKIADLEEQRNTRLKIMKYIELPEDNLNRKEQILDRLEGKIRELDLIKNEWIGKKSDEEKEFVRLREGKTIELPAAFREYLEQNGIDIIYGMEWLTKNGRSVEENRKLTEQNPFLPYAVIMEQGAYEKFEKLDKENYTKFPVPIIKKDELEKLSGSTVNHITSMEHIRFYIFFNHHLLDRSELEKMLEEIKSRIETLQKSIDEKEKELDTYRNYKNCIEYQSYSEELYQQTERELQYTMGQKTGSEEKRLKIRNERADIEEVCRKTEMQINQLRKNITEYENRQREFEKLCRKYEVYGKAVMSLKRIRNEKEELLKVQKQLTDSMKETEFAVHTITDKLKRIQEQEKYLRKKRTEYETYAKMAESQKAQKGMDTEIAKTEAAYLALTREISDSIEELKKRQEWFASHIVQKKRELEKKNRYKIEEKEYKNLLYSEEQYDHLENRKEQIERTLNDANENNNTLTGKIEMIKNELKHVYQNLKESTGYEEPVPRKNITDTEFEKRINFRKHDYTQMQTEIKSMQERKQQLSVFAEGMTEYEDESIETENKHVEEVKQRIPDIATVALDILAAYQKEKKKKKNQISKEMVNMQIQIYDKIHGIASKREYADEYFKKTFDSLLVQTKQPLYLSQQFEINRISYENQLEKLKIDLAEMDQEQKNIEVMLAEYIRQVNNNIAMIDKNSTITIRNRAVKMLKIQVPDWESEKEHFRLRLHDYFENVLKSAIYVVEKNENLGEYIGKAILTKRLYDEVVGIGNIRIKLYKIEEEREVPITWAQVSANSGGEGFLSAFVVLSCLLGYMRRDETDLFSNGEEGKVLIMDNPFAQTNAEHLLKPLMEMAKKTNTQLICLSGLGGDSIYNRFDNIYVLKLVDSGIRKGVQRIESRHIKGDGIREVVPSEFRVEQI